MRDIKSILRCIERLFGTSINGCLLLLSIFSKFTLILQERLLVHVFAGPAADLVIIDVHMVLLLHVAILGLMDSLNNT